MNELFKETETAIVKINASDYGLDETKAAELIKNLPQIIKEREVFVSQFDQFIIGRLRTAALIICNNSPCTPKRTEQPLCDHFPSQCV